MLAHHAGRLVLHRRFRVLRALHHTLQLRRLVSLLCRLLDHLAAALAAAGAPDAAALALPRCPASLCVRRRSNLWHVLHAPS